MLLNEFIEIETNQPWKGKLSDMLTKCTALYLLSDGTHNQPWYSIVTNLIQKFGENGWIHLRVKCELY